MSFRFTDSSKIAAITAAGVAGFPATWHTWSCGCQQASCDHVVATHTGWDFQAPVGVSGKAHGRAIRAILDQQ